MLAFEQFVTKTVGFDQRSTASTSESTVDLPEIDDIGLLDTQRHVEAFRRELDRCRGMNLDVVLAAVHQMLSSIANRQCGTLNMADVTAVLVSIQRAR